MMISPPVIVCSSFWSDPWTMWIPQLKPIFGLKIQVLLKYDSKWFFLLQANKVSRYGNYYAKLSNWWVNFSLAFVILPCLWIAPVWELVSKLGRNDEVDQIEAPILSNFDRCGWLRRKLLTVSYLIFQGKSVQNHPAHRNSSEISSGTCDF